MTFPLYIWSSAPVNKLSIWMNVWPTEPQITGKRLDELNWLKRRVKSVTDCTVFHSLTHGANSNSGVHLIEWEESLKKLVEESRLYHFDWEQHIFRSIRFHITRFYHSHWLNTQKFHSDYWIRLLDSPLWTNCWRTGWHTG